MHAQRTTSDKYTENTAGEREQAKIKIYWRAFVDIVRNVRRARKEKDTIWLYRTRL